MPTRDSTLAHSLAPGGLDPDQIARARLLLRRPVAKERVWPVLCAAGLAACTALMLATATILAPPVITEHVVGAKAPRQMGVVPGGAVESPSAPNS